MPTSHHHHDKLWIKETVASMPFAMRERAVSDYSALFEAAERDSTNMLSPEGDARFTANAWLRVLAERSIKISNGAVKGPPKVRE